MRICLALERTFALVHPILHQNYNKRRWTLFTIGIAGGVSLISWIVYAIAHNDVSDNTVGGLESFKWSGSLPYPWDPAMIWTWDYDVSISEILKRSKLANTALWTFRSRVLSDFVDFIRLYGFDVLFYRMLGLRLLFARRCLGISRLVKLVAVDNHRHHSRLFPLPVSHLPTNHRSNDLDSLCRGREYRPKTCETGESRGGGVVNIDSLESFYCRSDREIGEPGSWITAPCPICFRSFAAERDVCEADPLLPSSRDDDHPTLRHSSLRLRYWDADGCGPTTRDFSVHRQFRVRDNIW